MKIELMISRATVLLTSGTDEVLLTTNMPSPFPPEVSSDPLCIDFQVQAGHGAEYCRAHFGIEPEIIDTLPLLFQPRAEEGGIR